MKSIPMDKIFKKNIIVILLLVFFVLLCLIIKYKFIDYFINLDELVKTNVNSVLVSKHLTNSMKIITKFASVGGVLFVFIVSCLLFKDTIIRLLLLVDMCLTGILSLALKYLFSRPRPLEAIIKMPTSYSFPSGHTLFAVGFFGLILYFIYISKLNSKLKVLLVSIITFLILLIGFSRIYLGVHHFTDVIGGLIIGILVLIMFINTYQILTEDKI